MQVFIGRAVLCHRNAIFCDSISQSDFLKACTQNTCHHLQAERLAGGCSVWEVPNWGVGTSFWTEIASRACCKYFPIAQTSQWAGTWQEAEACMKGRFCSLLSWDLTTICTYFAGSCWWSCWASARFARLLLQTNQGYLYLPDWCLFMGGKKDFPQ